VEKRPGAVLPGSLDRSQPGRRHQSGSDEPLDASLVRRCPAAAGLAWREVLLRAALVEVATRGVNPTEAQRLLDGLLVRDRRSVTAPPGNEVGTRCGGMIRLEPCAPGCAVLRVYEWRVVASHRRPAYGMPMAC